MDDKYFEKCIPKQLKKSELVLSSNETFHLPQKSIRPVDIKILWLDSRINLAAGEDLLSGHGVDATTRLCRWVHMGFTPTTSGLYPLRTAGSCLCDSCLCE